MLLKHTPATVAERTAPSINPAKTCMPIGAMYAAPGHPRLLAPQPRFPGLPPYHRSMLTRHVREPVMAATSSFTEGSSVFGGQSNLLAAIENIFTIYNPQVIAVHTTCLSETIGDDLNQIIIKAGDDGKIPEGKYVFHANTPSYVGSHVTGFARMTKAMVDYYAEHDGTRNETINLIPGWVEPSDIRELTLCHRDEARVHHLPRPVRRVRHAPDGQDEHVPQGRSDSSPAQGRRQQRGDDRPGTDSFRHRHGGAGGKVQGTGPVAGAAVGLQATDRFIDALCTMTGVDVPDSILDDRGRVVDMITDMHQYF